MSLVRQFSFSYILNCKFRMQHAVCVFFLFSFYSEFLNKKEAVQSNKSHYEFYQFPIVSHRMTEHTVENNWTAPSG